MTHRQYVFAKNLNWNYNIVVLFVFHFEACDWMWSLMKYIIVVSCYYWNVRGAHLCSARLLEGRHSSIIFSVKPRKIYKEIQKLFLETAYTQWDMRQIFFRNDFFRNLPWCDKGLPQFSLRSNIWSRNTWGINKLQTESFKHSFLLKW